MRPVVGLFNCGGGGGLRATPSFRSSQDCSPQSVCASGQGGGLRIHCSQLRMGSNLMADTFTCSGLMPHAFGKSDTWLLDYVLKSPWPDGQGVGPLIQRLWVQVPLGILQQFSAWTTHQAMDLEPRPSFVSVLAPASIAQLAARGSHNPKGVSSILTGSTFCSLPPSLPMPLLIVPFRRMGLCSASAQRLCGLMDKAPLS